MLARPRLAVAAKAQTRHPHATWFEPSINTRRLSAAAPSDATGNWAANSGAPRELVVNWVALLESPTVVVLAPRPLVDRWRQLRFSADPSCVVLASEPRPGSSYGDGHDFYRRWRAKHRWVLTGTPSTPGPRQVAALEPLLAFVAAQPLLPREWGARPLSRGARFDVAWRLARLLRAVAVQHPKSALPIIPRAANV